jgi:hypothetical protein
LSISSQFFNFNCIPAVSFLLVILWCVSFSRLQTEIA